MIADRVVLLYAASGAGKSSLLNASLITLLEEEEHFEVLPIVRIRSGVTERALSSARNAYMHSTLLGWCRSPTDDTPDDPELSLAEFLARRPRTAGPDGFPVPRALIFDQFEELFTLYPGFWRQREPYFEQLAEALADDPLARIILAIREDYIAQLDSYGWLLPDALRARYRLERLRPEQALQAVVNPAQPTPRRYGPGVAEKLVSSLLTQRMDSGSGAPVEVEGEFVEPVQLQVTCRSLWSALPEDITKISVQDLQSFGDVNQALAAFYDGAVHDAATAANVTDRRVRRWIDRELITSVGTRGMAYRTAESTAGLRNAAIERLEDAHLVRAEWRAGARWYELTHDRLIEPIRAANRAAEVARRNRYLLVSGSVIGLLSIVAAIAAVVALHGAVVAGRGRPITGLCATLPAVAQGAAANSVAFSPAGVTLASGYSNGTVWLWDVASCRAVVTFRGSAGAAYSVSFSPLGTLGSGGANGMLVLWNVANGRIAERFVVGGPVRTVAFSPNGKLLAAGGDSGVRLFDVGTGREVGAPVGSLQGVASVAFTPDGRILAIAENHGVALVNLGSVKVISQVPTRAPALAAAVSPSGRNLAVGTEDGAAYLFEIAVMIEHTLSVPRPILQATAPVSSVAFSPDGSRLAVAASDGTVQTLTGPGRRIASFKAAGMLNSIAFSPDGTRLAGASSLGTVSIWPQ